MTAADALAAGYPTVHAAALAAWDAGLCPVQASTSGRKTPHGEWKEWQERRPLRTRVNDWFADGWPGLGVICGTVSGNLEMFEFEGAAMDAGLFDRFCDACDAAGLREPLDRLIEGYSEHTPTGGVHMFMHVDGQPHGNLKLARRADGTTMIETRGQGGFVIVAPSHGPTHPSRQPWVAAIGTFDRIATLTAAERDAIYDVARTLDEGQRSTPAPQPQPLTLNVPVVSQASGDRWFDDLVDRLSRTPWADILGRYGWNHSHTVGNVDYWTRPDKKVSEGHSATTNAKGTDRLIVFTSNPGTPHLESGRTPAPSYDRLDVIAAYEHNGDRIAAARHLADRPAPANVQYVEWSAPEPTRTPPPNVDPETGEILNAPILDETFWAARPVLTHIRQAARSRLVAPTAVLGCVLAHVSAFTPPSTCLPAIVGSHAPLSTYIALRGRSGAGKSTPAACARDLMGATPPGCIGPVGLGSGEGLVEAYMEFAEEKDKDGKVRKVKRQVRHGALFSLDEGQALAELASRKGSTIMSVLRTAWSGGDPGQANASVETRRSLKPNSYHLGLVSLWQDKAAGQLLADVDGGTPQRFVWLETDDPQATDDVPDWPGQIDWRPPASIVLDGEWRRSVMGVDPQIAAEVRAARLAELRGEQTPAPLDAHRRLVKLKVAGVLALLDSREAIDLDDWTLAEQIMRSSDATRQWVIDENRRAAQAVEKAAAHRAAGREAVVEDLARARSLASAVRAVVRVARKNAPEKFTKREVHSAVASRDRERVTVDEAIEKAVSDGLVRPSGDGQWVLDEAV